jgi:hypothetical protein
MDSFERGARGDFMTLYTVAINNLIR